MTDLHTISAYWSAAAQDPQGGCPILYAAIAAELDYLTTLVEQHDPDAYETAERIAREYGPQIAKSDRDDLWTVVDWVGEAVPVERVELERGAA